MKNQTITGGLFELAVEDGAFAIMGDIVKVKETVSALSKISEAMAAEFASIPFDPQEAPPLAAWPCIGDYLRPHETAERHGYELNAKPDNDVGSFRSVIDGEESEFPSFVLRDAITVIYEEDSGGKPGSGSQGLTFALPASLPGKIGTDEEGIKIARYERLFYPHDFDEKNLSAIIIPELDLVTYSQALNIHGDNAGADNDFTKWRPPFLLPWPWAWGFHIQGVHFMVDLFDQGEGLSHPAVIPLEKFEFFDSRATAEFFEDQTHALKSLAETLKQE